MLQHQNFVFVKMVWYCSLIASVMRYPMERVTGLELCIWSRPQWGCQHQTSAPRLWSSSTHHCPWSPSSSHWSWSSSPASTLSTHHSTSATSTTETSASSSLSTTLFSQLESSLLSSPLSSLLLVASKEMFKHHTKVNTIHTVFTGKCTG